MSGRIIAFLAALMIAASTWAVAPGEQLPDAAAEARARRLSAELRCLVCQNQSIDDSDAPLAKDLRRLVRERILAGENDAAIRAFLVARYGEFVLLKPPVSERTLLLWFLPGIALLLGGAAAWRLFRRSPEGEGDAETETAEEKPPAGLSDPEQQALDALLARRRDGA